MLLELRGAVRSRLLFGWTQEIRAYGESRRFPWTARYARGLQPLPEATTVFREPTVEDKSYFISETAHNLGWA